MVPAKTILVPDVTFHTHGDRSMNMTASNVYNLLVYGAIKIGSRITSLMA